MSLNHSVFREGQDAAYAGRPLDSNPYREYIRQQVEDAPGIWYEHANDWDSGWIAETTPILRHK